MKYLENKLRVGVGFQDWQPRPVDHHPREPVMCRAPHKSAASEVANDYEWEGGREEEEEEK
jgi:hypothetical protein